MMARKLLCAFVLLAGVRLAHCASLPIVPYPTKAVERPGVLEVTAASAFSSPARETRDPSVLPEGYRLTISPSGISIVSSDAAGAFYARQTLRQLVREEAPSTARPYPAAAVRQLSFPCVEIEDAPRYRWRGMLLDEGRFFFGREAVFRLIDRLAQHKMNVLHWHLTEDQGWRLDLKGFPELVGFGSVRPESPVRDCRGIPEDYLGDGTRYGPFFYTAADIRAVLAHAASNHVAVVPEIEIPGHVRALLAAHPEFSCRGDIARTPRCMNAVEDDVLCAGNDAALAYVERVYEAVCELFPGVSFHIGGDECPKKRWKACPRCQARMKSLGLENEEALQGWLTTRFVRFLSRKGRRVIGWDEVMSGGADRSTLVQCWQGVGKVAEAVSNGYDVIASPALKTYFSCPQGLKDDPFVYLSPRIRLTLADAYSFDPVVGLSPDAATHVLGGECCLWSERIFNEDDLAWKSWPRACAFAEKVWSGNLRTFDDFRARLSVHRRRLLRQGVNCSPLE